MVDHAGAACRAQEHRKIPDVPAEHLELAAEFRREAEVDASAGREVVEDADASAVGQEPLDEVRADEAGSSRHEREIVHSPIVSSPARATLRRRRSTARKSARSGGPASR